MAQIHFDDASIEPHCVAEMWPDPYPSSNGLQYKTAVITLGTNLCFSMDREEFLNLCNEMKTTKDILGW